MNRSFVKLEDYGFILIAVWHIIVYLYLQTCEPLEWVTFATLHNKIVYKSKWCDHLIPVVQLEKFERKEKSIPPLLNCIFSTKHSIVIKQKKVTTYKQISHNFSLNKYIANTYKCSAALSQKNNHQNYFRNFKKMRHKSSQ